MQGNYCVHSGSHVTLLEEYKKKVSNSLETVRPYFLLDGFGRLRLVRLFSQIIRMLYKNLI